MMFKWLKGTLNCTLSVSCSGLWNNAAPCWFILLLFFYTTTSDVFTLVLDHDSYVFGTYESLDVTDFGILRVTETIGFCVK